MVAVVTCAAEETHGSLDTPDAKIQVGYNASSEDIQQAFNKAAKEAIDTGHPVYVRMTH